MIEVRKIFSLLFILGLFLTGCVTTKEYVYQDNEFKLAEEQPEKVKEEISQKKWMDIYFEENNFIMQCPVCLRRYPANVERCPYDDAELEQSKEEII